MGKIIVGNWKMNPESLNKAKVIFNSIVKYIKGVKGVEVVICPPYPFLCIGDKLKIKNINIGAQGVSEELKGSYTGEVSIKMLSSLGLKYVILGHSENRAKGETNISINKKVLLTLKAKITPIICIGEKDRDDNGFYLAYVKHQLLESLSSVPRSQIKNIIIAYEPIWAIGGDSLREATKDEFVEIQIFIKKIISDLYDIKIASITRVIYGGSVNPLNAKEFLDNGASGLLIGRSSLSPKKFGDIIKLTK